RSARRAQGGARRPFGAGAESARRFDLSRQRVDRADEGAHRLTAAVRKQLASAESLFQKQRLILRRLLRSRKRPRRMLQEAPNSALWNVLRQAQDEASRPLRGASGRGHRLLG